MDQQFLDEELKERTFWEKKREEIRQRFLDEELKEQEFWGKKREQMRQHFLDEELKEREFWEKKRNAMKQHYQDEEEKEREFWEKKKEEMKQAFLEEDMKERQFWETKRDKMRQQRLYEEENEHQNWEKTKPETIQTSLAEVGQTRQDEVIQLQPRGSSLPSTTQLTSPWCLKRNTLVPGIDKQSTSTPLTTLPHVLNSQPATSIPLIPNAPETENVPFSPFPSIRPPNVADLPVCEPSQLLNFETQFKPDDSFIYPQGSDSSSSSDGWSVGIGPALTSDPDYETYYDKFAQMYDCRPKRRPKRADEYALSDSEKIHFCVAHEIQESEENDFEQQFLNHFHCEDRGRHSHFKPVNRFTTKHLPKGYRDNDIVELIKATADLTVRVLVKKTSNERPQFWPNTKEKYAFYDRRESDVMRLGTGMIRFVYKYGEKYNKKYRKGTCKCQKCQQSDAPSKVWGKIRLFTATQLVFDEFESRHTTCRLFYDKINSPVVSLDGWTAKGTNIKEDISELKCVTCDVDLLDKLGKVWDRWQDLRFKITNKYKANRKADKLNFIVSHPHGWSKRVSLGRWKDRYEVGKHLTRFTYTTSTCPGSTGAHVYSLGYDDCLYNELHVHSGIDPEGINMSSTGRETNF